MHRKTEADSGCFCCCLCGSRDCGVDSDEPENDPLTDSRQHEQLHVNRMIGKALTFEEAIRLVPYPVKQPEISDVPFEVLGTVAFVRDMGPHLVLVMLD